MSFDLTFFKSELDGLLHQLGVSRPLEKRGQQAGAKSFQIRGLSIDIECGNYSAYPYDAKRASMKYRFNVGWNKPGAPDQWPHPKLVEFMGNSVFDALKNEHGFSRVSANGIGFLETDRSTFIRRVKEFLVWWDSAAALSKGAGASSASASNSPNRIYIVAGERIVELAQANGKGLWANVGQTTSQVADRLRANDYKRKAAGGKWVILYDQVVGNLSDKEIHPFLKSHPRVEHDKDSSNTEEFKFLDDPGDGSEAIKIIEEILSSRCAPLLKG